MNRVIHRILLTGGLALTCTTIGSGAELFSTFVEVKQGVLPAAGTFAYFSADTLPAMVQSWDGSDFTAEIRVGIPTGTIGAGAASQRQREVGLLIASPVNLTRYVVGLFPSQFSASPHYAMGVARWENGGSLQLGGPQNMAGLTGSDIYADFRVTFTDATGDLNVEYKGSTAGSYSYLTNLTAFGGAAFNPTWLGIASVMQRGDVNGTWAPVGGQPVQFDYFHISGGTGAAVSDDFNSTNFTASTWTTWSGKLAYENQTLFTQVPEPAAITLLLLGALALHCRARRAPVIGSNR